jgi:hypothetical protein
MKARIGEAVYWLFTAVALLLLATSWPDTGRGAGPDIGQVLAAAVLYAIGRDVRRVLRE